MVCPELSEPENGTITYSINQPPPFPFGTEAKYTCNFGLGLEGGDVLRVCLGDVVNTVGQWNGAAPQCNGRCRLRRSIYGRWFRLLSSYTIKAHCGHTSKDCVFIRKLTHT